ncbi:MAG: hypothetical protein FJ098_09915, partial [Deltaproteobacteria bacterium]|nr:hypothetical protein [Deltaproteobacteria bacterium]
MDSRIDSEYHSLAAMDPPVTARASGESGHRLLFLVTVRLERSRRTSRYQTGDVPTQPGDVVVVDAERGTALGRVIGQAVNTWVKASETPPRVLRRIQESDPWSRDRHTDREDAFRRECAASAAAYGLDLKVTDAEFLHWENRVIFYFVSEGRVDFRDLVRELSRRLRCRVEMRQVGPRDETRLLGGVGTCGREFCCATHLTQFESIRIRMVKDQGLVLNPQKVSGGCGKLKCCLAYEVDVYRDLRKGMPALGRMVQTPDGPGKVREVNVLSRKVGVLLDGQGGYKTYLAALLSSPEGEAYDPEGRARLEEAEREEAADLGGHDGAPPPGG